MTPDVERPQREGDEDGSPQSMGKVQCPNCCRLAPVIRRGAELLYFRCELGLTTGAVPMAENPT